MSDEMSSDVRAEVEQGKRYRARRIRWSIPEIDRSKLQLLCFGVLLLCGLFFVYGGRQWIVYWYRPAASPVRFIAVALICFLGYWMI
jgi:hypothetical protein